MPIGNRTSYLVVTPWKSNKKIVGRVKKLKSKVCPKESDVKFIPLTLTAIEGSVKVDGKVPHSTLKEINQMITITLW